MRSHGKNQRVDLLSERVIITRVVEVGSAVGPGTRDCHGSGVNGLANGRLVEEGHHVSVGNAGSFSGSDRGTIRVEVVEVVVGKESVHLSERRLALRRLRGVVGIVKLATRVVDNVAKRLGTLRPNARGKSLGNDGVRGEQRKDGIVVNQLGGAWVANQESLERKRRRGSSLVVSQHLQCQSRDVGARVALSRDDQLVAAKLRELAIPPQQKGQIVARRLVVVGRVGGVGAGPGSVRHAHAGGRLHPEHIGEQIPAGGTIGDLSTAVRRLERTVLTIEEKEKQKTKNKKKSNAAHLRLPATEEHPGPPLRNTIRGSLEGFLALSAKK